MTLTFAHPESCPASRDETQVVIEGLNVRDRRSSPADDTGLEREAQPKLELPRNICDLVDCPGTGLSDDDLVRVARSRGRQALDIEEIECFGAELAIDSVMNGNVLEHREIREPHLAPSHDVSGKVSKLP